MDRTVTEKRWHSTEDLSANQDEDGHNVSDGEGNGDHEASEVISSSTSLEKGIVKGGHNLRQRVPGPANAWRDRELSRTPSPSSSRSSSQAKSSPHDSQSQKRSQYHQSKQPGKSFEEFSAEYEQENMRMRHGTEKTIEDFAFKGFQKKRTVPSKIHGWAQRLSQKIRTIHPVILLIVTAVIVVLVVCGMLYFPGNKNLAVPTTSESMPWKTAQSQLRKEVLKIYEKFPLQNRETIIHLISAINSTLGAQEPKQPSAVTILVPPSIKNAGFPRCFALKFASIVNDIFSRVLNVNLTPVKTLDLPYFDKNSHDVTGIHTDLKSYLDGGAKALIVEDVDRLKTLEQVLIFHAFCDNFKAHDKRATFLFLVPVPSALYEKYGWKQESGADISNDVLDMAWKDVLTDDSRPALIARVAASVVLLNEGDSCL